MTRKSINLLVATALLSGCYGLRGPHPVLSPGGVVTTDRHNQPRRQFIYARFRDIALRAGGCVATGQPAPDAAGDVAPAQCDDSNVPADQTARDELMRRYMRAGFLLIQAECADYFSVMGRNQGRSGIIRDIIGPLSALITGIISLRTLNTDDEQNILTGLQLVTTAATAGLNIYDQRFLFGSDNIDSVRDLVTRSMSTQANTALAKTGLNFESASAEILNSQTTCTPPAILRLTRSAIQAGQPAANRTDASGQGQTQTTPQTSYSSPLFESTRPAPPTSSQPRRPPEGQGLSTTSVSVPQ